LSSEVYKISGEIESEIVKTNKNRGIYSRVGKRRGLINTKEVIAKFERRLITEVSRQEKLIKSNFRREKLLGKFTVKILYK